MATDHIYEAPEVICRQQCSCAEHAQLIFHSLTTRIGSLGMLSSLETATCLRKHFSFICLVGSMLFDVVLDMKLGQAMV